MNPTKGRLELHHVLRDGSRSRPNYLHTFTFLYSCEIILPSPLRCVTSRVPPMPYERDSPERFMVQMEIFPKLSHVDWIVLDNEFDESHISSCSDMFSHVPAYVRERVFVGS